MNAQLKIAPIVVTPLKRPRFDNCNYTDYVKWVRDNIDKLEEYFDNQGQVLGDGELTDFNRWCACQWDLEEQRAAWDLVDQI